MRKTLSWAAVLIWAAFIFFLSSQAAEQSDRLSTGITQAIVETIEGIVPDAEIVVGSLNHLIRKYAHFFAYLILGLLVAGALTNSGVHGLKRILAAVLICVLYASSDEIHQLFVPGRGGMVTDVLIDSAGAVIGIGVIGAFRR